MNVVNVKNNHFIAQNATHKDILNTIKKKNRKMILNILVYQLNVMMAFIQIQIMFVYYVNIKKSYINNQNL